MSDQTRRPLTMRDLRSQRTKIIALAEQYGAYNVRVFGSVARDEQRTVSDVDFLVSFEDGRSIFDQVGLWLDLKALLGCEVDLLTDHPDAGPVTAIARQEAVPL